jgi:glycosyltransferase involved in cell wall biosynthesis
MEEIYEMNKPILIFIDWFLPGYKAGGPISSNANLIAHLSNEFQFKVITRDTDYCETDPYLNIKSNAWNKHPNGAEIYYISKEKLSLKAITKISREVSFNAVFINGIYSWYFSLFPLLWFKYVKQKKVIVSARGMLSDHTFSSKKIKKKVFYLIARTIGLYKGVTIHATNNDEAAQIRKNIAFKGEIMVAPNLPPKISMEFHSVEKTYGQLKLISIARISPEKNTLFALNCLLAYSKKGNSSYEQILLDLYGTIYNESYWGECKSVIAALPPDITVNYKGPLEKEKIGDTIQNYHFLFMPSQGENYGHSIVESLIHAKPVIISDRTPWKGLSEIRSSKSEVLSSQSSEPPTSNLQPPTDAGIGWDLPLEQPERFVEIIEYCARMGQEEYDAMSRRAFEYAKQVTQDPEVLEANRRLFD